MRGKSLVPYPPSEDCQFPHFLAQTRPSGGPHPPNESPLAIPFSLSNGGFFAVYPKEIICWVYRLDTDERSGVEDIGLIDKTTSGELNGGHTVDFLPKFTVFNFGSARIRSAELLLIARYRPSFWPKKIERRVHFSVSRDSDGRMRYLRPFLTDVDRSFRPEDHTLLSTGVSTP
jgi:hypothetical protein